MKKFYMKLNEGPFEDISNKTKTIENRLNDEKRQQLSVGDHIEFSKLPDLKEKITVEITDLKYYTNREELIKANDMKIFGRRFSQLSKEEFLQRASIYSVEQIQKYGMVSIHLKVIDTD